MPKLHTFLRLHVSDYKISGTTIAVQLWTKHAF